MSTLNEQKQIAREKLERANEFICITDIDGNTHFEGYCEDADTYVEWLETVLTKLKLSLSCNEN